MTLLTCAVSAHHGPVVKTLFSRPKEPNSDSKFQGVSKTVGLGPSCLVRLLQLELGDLHQPTPDQKPGPAWLHRAILEKLI